MVMGVPPRLRFLAPCLVAAATVAGLWAGPALAPAAADVLTPPTSAPPSTPGPSAPSPATPTLATSGIVPTDFWLATTAGQVWSFGDAGAFGSLAGASLNKPIVGIAPTADRQGYWLVASDGGIFSFGDAAFYGSTGSYRLNKPIVGMAPTASGQGYWMVASDGGIFSFGDAAFNGSTGSYRLNKPIVGMAPTASGQGYWLVASDGGIFSFGDAAFHGSTGSYRLNRPIVAMAPASDGAGYWLLASDGGVFSFGSAGFHGSTGGDPTPDPAETIVAAPHTDGYWIVDQNGTAHPFGAADGAPPVQGLMFSGVTAGDRAVLFALSQLGKPYIWGGNGPNGYDCSGLALASWKSAGVTFARVANDQYHTAGPAVPLAALQAGDLVFWGSNLADWTTVYHTALYVGGGGIVESTGDHVQTNSLDQWGLDDLMPNGVRP